MSSTTSKLKVRISAIAQEGSNQRAFTLVPCDDAYLPAYEAGAHIDVHISENLVRQYSLATRSSAGDPYLLCIKRDTNSRGGSARLYDYAKVGDELWISTPRNLFRLEPASTYTLLAAGIGITPILCMAQTLDQENRSFVLHYYSRNSQETAFLTLLERGFSCGSVIFHYSALGDSLREQIPPALRQPDPDGRLYVCGPHGFIDRLQSITSVAGFPAERFHYERFAPLPTSENTADGTFELELRSSQKIFLVPAERTIAEVLTKAGIPTKLSCEQGMCGACLTRVLAGEPDHRDSVQSAKERASNGFIAICCSRSKSSRLILDL